MRSPVVMWSQLQLAANTFYFPQTFCFSYIFYNIFFPFFLRESIPPCAAHFLWALQLTACCQAEEKWVV